MQLHIFPTRIGFVLFNPRPNRYSYNDFLDLISYLKRRVGYKFHPQLMDNQHGYEWVTSEDELISLIKTHNSSVDLYLECRQFFPHDDKE